MQPSVVAVDASRLLADIDLLNKNWRRSQMVTDTEKASFQRIIEIIKLFGKRGSSWRIIYKSQKISTSRSVWM